MAAVRAARHSAATGGATGSADGLARRRARLPGGAPVGACACAARRRAAAAPPRRRSAAARRRGAAAPRGAAPRGARPGAAGRADLVVRASRDASGSAADGRHPPATRLALASAAGAAGARAAGAAGAETAGGDVAFLAFSRPRPGVRLVRLQACEFYAYTYPRTGCSHIVVWRRLGDAVNIGYGVPCEDSETRVGVFAPGQSLSPGRRGLKVEGPLVDLYGRRAYDRGAWTYWESFWAPVGDGDCAPLLPAVAEAPAGPGRSVPEAMLAEVKARLPPPPPREEKASAFAEIYRAGVWPGLASRSGPGSDPFHPMVRVALTALHAAVDALGATSLLDAACGDAGWIAAHFLPQRPGLAYTGVDIVAHVIEENRRHHPALDFRCVDLGGEFADVSALPAVDLVFSKETLNHMVVQDALRAVHRWRTMGCKFLLANIARGAPNFRGVEKGGHMNYAHYDYELPPFCLRKFAPLVEINADDWSEFALFYLQ